MRISARAPGKLVVLGEYAVLAGAPALVMAVRRRAYAQLGPGGGDCRLETFSPQRRELAFRPGQASGVAVVDQVLGMSGAARRLPAWRGLLDSRELFVGADKLGMGSSAAALCAWSGAWAAYARQSGIEHPPPDLARLVGAHRSLQGGSGSGLDVAACLIGGVIRYQLVDREGPSVGSVRLPKGVAFAGVFAGRSACTPSLLTGFEAWRAARSRQSARQLDGLAKVANAACAAAAADHARGFLDAVAEYGRGLDLLGRAIGADIVTAEHHDIGREAQRHGVVYKVSGAGGGDLGLALSSEPPALEAFKQSVAGTYHVVDLDLDEQGLVVEERAE